MPKKLRFTGEWPPQKFWAKYPNWEYAVDEEGIKGQDETTLKPADEQRFIAEFVSFTAGNVWLANGRQYAALVEMSDTPNGLNTFQSKKAWRIYYNEPANRWVRWEAKWLPKHRRPPVVSFNDKTVFPLVIETILPRNLRGRPWRIKVYGNGKARNL